MKDQNPKYGLASRALVLFLRKHRDEIDLTEQRSGFREKRA